MRIAAAPAPREISAAASRGARAYNMEIASAFALWVLLSILGWGVVAVLLKALAA